MNGRAAAVYGLVFLLVAAGAFAVVTVMEPPEPSMENPSVVAAEGDNVSIGDREYQVTGFGPPQRGQPTATLTWTDEDARSQETWDHAAAPDGTTIEYDGGVYWVRIPQTTDPASFTLLESPGEDSNVSVFADDGTWIVNESGEYVDLENYDALERVEIENGSTLTRGSGNETQQVRVDSVTNASVTVSWNDPAETERVARQNSRSEINGQNLTVDVHEDGTVAIAFEEAEIEDYFQQHDDKDDFQTRIDGLRMASVISLVSFVLLIGMAFLPRKE